MIPLLLATLAVGIPVSCQPPAGIAGQYLPRSYGGPAIVIHEPYCGEVRDGTVGGAVLLAHELGHAYQDARGLRFDEGQADRLAGRWWPALWRRLGGRSFVTLAGWRP